MLLALHLALLSNCSLRCLTPITYRFFTGLAREATRRGHAFSYLLCRHGRRPALPPAAWPDVAYNRIGTGPDDLPNDDALRESLAEAGTVVFNFGSIGKGAVAGILAPPEVRSAFPLRVPETIFPATVGAFAGWLESGQGCYLKRPHSCRGRGTFVIRPASAPGRFVVVGQDTLTPTSWHLPAARVVDLLAERIIKGPHLLQSIAPVSATRGGRITSLRAHVCRDGSGQWQVAAHMATIGGPLSASSHRYYGGRVVPAGEALREMDLPGARIPLDSVLERALAAAAVLGGEGGPETGGLLPGRVGELGLDLGVDADGQVWLFEVNIKPGPGGVTLVQGQAALDRVTGLLLDHMESLAPARR